MRGFFGIGHYQPAHDTNVGTTHRTAMIYGASFLFTIGRKYSTQGSDTTKAHHSLPYYWYESFENLVENKPRGTKIVAVELSPKAISLDKFWHPSQAIYLLGNESYGIHQVVLEKCDYIVQIPTIKDICMNVATAGAILMYSRYCQMRKDH